MIQAVPIAARRYLKYLMLIKNGNAGAIQEIAGALKTVSADGSRIQRQMSAGLGRMLRFAYQNIPYYQDLLGKQKESSLALDLFPILTKEIINQERKRLVDPNIKERDLERSFTGGSSGTPTSFYRDRACTSKRLGRQAGILESIGCPFGERVALVWGAHQDLANHRGRNRLKLSMFRWISGREILDSSSLTDIAMLSFYKKVKESKIQLLYGYPNALDEFAAFIYRKGLAPLTFRKIYTTAERLTEKVRHNLETNFHGEVYDLYCTREHGCIGFECSAHQGYHIDTHSVLVETFENDKPVAPGEIGDIITTDLLNYGMPMIRYKIGDRGVLSDQPCSCGCKLPLLKKLHGRVSDCIYRTDGTPLSGLLLIDMFLDDLVIKQMQIVQESYREITVNLVAASGFDERDKRRVTDETCKFVGTNAVIKVNVVDALPVNTNSGKFPEVLSKIKRTTRSSRP